jgi:hypothetical protein
MASFLEPAEALDQRVALVSKFDFFGFGEVHLVGGEAKLYVFGGDVKVDERDVCGDGDFEDVSAVDDVGEGQADCAQEVGSVVYDYLALSHAFDLDHFGARGSKGWVVVSVQLEKNGLGVFVYDGYRLADLDIDEDISIGDLFLFELDVCQLGDVQTACVFCKLFQAQFGCGFLRAVFGDSFFFGEE